MNKMNKKLSIIMLLSCVGNVFSMGGGGAAGGGDQGASGFIEKAKAMTTEGANAIKELPSVIYLSTADAAKKVGDLINTKPGVFLVSSACTLGGYQVYRLPQSQNAVSVAKQAFSNFTQAGSAFACKAGSATCRFLSNSGSNTLSKVSSVSRNAAEFIVAHPAGACVAAVAACGLGWGIHKRRQATAEEAKTLSDFLANFSGNVNGDNGIRTPLVAAVEDNNLPLIKLLIKKGAIANQQLLDDQSGHKGKDALFFAAHWGRPEIVNALLAAGADNFVVALDAAEVSKDKGHPNTGTVVEYQAVINSIEAAQAKAAAISSAVAGGGAARSN